MAEEGQKMAGPIRMVAIENMMENIRYKAQLIARSNKYDSAILGMGLVGFAAGLLTALVLIVVPALVMR
ncbi:MAG: tetrahydromethanopterin S-methyltransferase subunit F [Methanolinea sp.]|nr:tetrahydromethanopterin S-methyltransferase subunit F [Methanolinea sp.]